MTLPASGALTLDNIQTEFGGTNPIGLNEYYAGGGLVPAGASGTYGAVPSSGAISVQNFYGTSAYTPVYIEELFSTHLYSGNGSTQTITNGVDLAGKGGLVWIKSRNSGNNHRLVDSARGNYNTLITSSTAAQYDASPVAPTLTSTGFTVGNWSEINDTGLNYVSWTFRKQPKFFDVVTWTGNGAATQTINHNLGAVPGCIIYKYTSGADDWHVYHRSLSTSGGVPYWLNLNNTSAEMFFGGGIMLSGAPTSTTFTVKGAGNGAGNSYVAYIFAHDAGGFGPTGTDNVISCGSFTTDSGGLATVNLGYEPQWLLVKCISNADHWNLMDQMRGWNMPTTDATLYANLTNAESTANWGNPTATGFEASFGSSRTYIYIAIRRGPMKVPTDASKVFGINLYSGTGSQQTITTPFNAPDAALSYVRNAGGWSSPIMYDRLRGNRGLFTDQTVAELASADYGAVISTNAQAQEIVGMFGSSSGKTYVTWSFARAPGFFDEVCYTGTGAARTVDHNLAAVPELMISKRRSGTAEDWFVYHSAMGAGYYVFLNLPNSKAGPNSGPWNSTAPTATVFSTGDWYASGATYVTYLFATCPGVSKVGSYTGTGAALQIDCGFTAGARFVMIKRTDSSGGWLVFDSARGITAGNDPYLYLNSTTYGEITFDNFIHPYSAGFQLTNSPYGAEVNANGGSYIYLAIA